MRHAVQFVPIVTPVVALTAVVATVIIVVSVCVLASPIDYALLSADR